MEIILLEKVQNLGDLGDLVKVKAGYARNYLIPQGKASFATEESKSEVARRRHELEAAAQKRLEEARARAKTLKDFVVEIARKASEEGTLFGSVSNADIAETVSARGAELEKSEVDLAEGPLKSLGEHTIAVSLHPEVHFSITVIVVEED